ncbi:MAG: hypothetical protein IPK11_12185 [Ignavibacteria bacterium]|jgi:tetratricopeptide (TPR) repeat protein|nr:hypothetical protein [Ignavibacteria bacterium]
MKKVLLFILFSAFSVVYSQQSIENYLADAKKYDRYHRDELALQKYRLVLESSPQHLEALCGASINSVRIGNREINEEKKTDYFRDALTYAQKAISINPNHDEANFCMAAALGRKAESLGPKERLSMAKEIKKYADKCVSINPNHAGGHHIIGRWHHRFSNLSFFEKAAANTLFGGIPSEVSESKGLYHLKKATELKTDFIMYLYDYAVALADADKENDAIPVLKNALQKKAQTHDDPKYLEKCKSLLSDLE